jgi:hypothetical protein
VFIFLVRLILVDGCKDGKLAFLFLDIFEDVGLEGNLNGKIGWFLVIFIVGFYLF